jgi:UDP-3-O-[3-hydroxymyristoyl] glucosamine N-acyltransferase
MIYKYSLSNKREFGTMIRRISCLIRDIVKVLYLGAIQLRTRLFYIKREMPSSISLSARLDIIPRGPDHKRHRLVLKVHSLIERWAVVNTWHGDVILEEGATVGIGSIIIGPVVFAKNTGCGQNCFISGQSHRYRDISISFRTQGFEVSNVIIEEEVYIGSNCVILPGIRIGRNSVIGAGSVVTKNIPAFSVAVGNPARVIKHYDAETQSWVKT